jgi:hypothetical protein
VSEQAKRNPDELGALWVKSGRKGDYMTGTIEGVGAVVLFRNDRKVEGSKQPDWRVLKSKPKDEQRGGEDW